MKLFYCLKCHDALKIIFEERHCSCGRAGGVLIDEADAKIWGTAVPLGINNHSLGGAIQTRRARDEARRFDAFVIARATNTVHYDHLHKLSREASL